MNPGNKEPYKPPDAVIEAFARRIYPVILEYFESEQGQREFLEWKKRQEVNTTVATTQQQQQKWQET